MIEVVVELGEGELVGLSLGEGEGEFVGLAADEVAGELVGLTAGPGAAAIKFVFELCAATGSDRALPITIPKMKSRPAVTNRTIIQVGVLSEILLLIFACTLRAKKSVKIMIAMNTAKTRRANQIGPCTLYPPGS